MIGFGFRRLCLIATLSIPCLIGSWAQGQSFSIGSNGFTSTNVCSSANVTQGCQVATNGNAAEVPAGENTPSLLRITPALVNQTGSAWYVSPQSFASGFDTKFQFQLNGGSGADGIALVMQTAGLSAIGYTGGNGGALGYGDDDLDQFPTSGIAGSVAFEFDTFMNTWDPDGNHVAIQSCGPNPNTSHHNMNCPSNTEFGNSTIALASLGADIVLTGPPHVAEIKYVVTPPPVGCEVECVTTRILTVSIDGNVVSSGAVDLTTYLGAAPVFVGFTAGTGSLNNNQDILSWSYVASQQSTPQPTGGGTTNTFIFNGNIGQRVEHILAFPNDAQPPEGIDTTTLTIQSANNLISDSTLWPEYDVGGPFSPSHCFVKPGDVSLSGGTDTCSLYEDTCADATHGPAEGNCPIVPDTSPNSIHITDLWDAPTGEVQIAPGTTAALIHFYPTHGETWDPFGFLPEPAGAVNPACTDPTSSTSSAAPNNCDLSNLDNFSLTSDPTSSGNTKRKGKFISAYNIPMLETAVSADGTQTNVPGVQGSTTTWVNTSTVNLNFLVNPAQAPPPPNNNFAAAPVKQFTYRLTDPTGSTVFIPDTTLLASDLTHAAPVNFNTNTPMLPDGTYRLSWFSLDNVKIKEQNIQLVPAVGGLCPDGTASLSGSCYTTNLFYSLIGVDTQAPSIALVTPPGPQPPFPSAIYPANSAVYASYSCNDGNGSGDKTCAGPVPSGNKIDTKPTNGISTTKTFAVTATDFAGNMSAATATYYVSCHYVQFGVSPMTVARGGTVNVTTSIMDCKSSNQKLTIQLKLSGPLGKNCSNTTLPMFSFPLTVPAGTSKSFSFPVTIPKCQCGGTFTLTTTTLVNQVQVDQTSVSLTVQ